MTDATPAPIAVAAPEQVFAPVVPAAPETPPAAPAPVEPAATPAVPAAENVADLPQWAQDKLTALNRENASTRVNAKQAAADEARQELAQQLAAVLNPGKEAEPVDPAKLTEQLTAAQKTAADTARDFAIYKAATAAGADPQALLDSLTFRNTVSGLDPADNAALAAAITTAVTDNPRFKTVQAAGASGADFTGGTGEGAMSKEKFAAMSYAQRAELYSTNPTLYRQLAG